MKQIRIQILILILKQIKTDNKKKGGQPPFSKIKDKKEKNMTNIDFATFQTVLNQQRSNTNNDIAVHFYDKSIKTPKINPKSGLPVFKNVCFVQIRIKNNNTDIYDQPATDAKKQQYAIEYNHYLNEKKQQSNGTPLNQFSFLTACQIDTLKAGGIFTVETLANLTDTQAQDLDIVAEKNAAKTFITLSKNTLEMTQLLAENKALKDEIAALKAKKTRKKTKKTTPETLEPQIDITE